MSKALSTEVHALGTALAKVQTALATLSSPTPAPNVTRTAPRSVAHRQNLFAGTTLAKRASLSRALSLGAGHTLFKYSPDQPRDKDGQWTETGAGGDTATATAEAPTGSNWRRAALGAGGLALLASAVVAAAAVRNPAAVARVLIGGSRRVDDFTGNFANRVLFGGGGVTTRMTVGAVSRSKLEAGAYNISNANKSMLPQLQQRFGDLDIVVKRTGDLTVALTVKSKGLTDKAIYAMHGSGNTDILKNSVYFSAIVDTKVGNVILVESLYAPNTAAGKFFTQKAFSTVRDLAVANKADAITTPAGWAMGGYLWPNAGFQLLGAGFPPISLSLRVAGVWEDTVITAGSVRAIVEMRAKELFATSRIDRASYGKVLAQLDDINWGPDSAAILSNMNQKVNIDGIKLLGMPHTAAQREIRGDVTLGKVLLTHTNGTYILPKHLYERMFVINKRALAKMLAKYSPDQPRDEQGQWTAGGGGGAATAAPVNIAGPKPVDYQGADAGDKWRLAAATALGLGVTVTGAGAYVIARRAMAPAQLVVRSVTTASGKPFLLGVETGAAETAAMIKTTLDRLPASHLAALKANGISVFAVRNMGAVEEVVRAGPVVTNSMYGLYHPVLRGVVIPRAIMVNGKEYMLPLALQQRVLVHEIAHALDAKGAGVGHLSRPMLNTITADYAGYLKRAPEDGKLVHSWFLRNYGTSNNIRNEIFAEVYSAKYLNKGNWRVAEHQFFGEMMNEHMVAKHFAKTMAAMDKMDVSKPRGFASSMRHMFETRAMSSAALPPVAQANRLRDYFSSTKRAAATKVVRAP